MSAPAISPRDPVNRQILDKGADHIGRELQSEPGVRAALMSTMGQAYHSLGLYKEAERLHEEALGLRRQTLGLASASTSCASLAEPSRGRIVVRRAAAPVVATTR